MSDKKQDFPRIAIVKTGWSEDYQGGAITGNYSYVERNDEGHERFNFRPGPDGRFYGYLPPIGKDWSVPNPSEKQDWLLVFVSKRPGKPGLFIVGWFEQAEFMEEYVERPEYADGAFELDAQNDHFLYAIVASSGTLVPDALRTEKLDTDRIKRTPIAYLRGGSRNEPWREELARKVLQQIEALETELGRQGWKRRTKGKFTSPDKEHRDEVERQSMAAAIAALEQDGYAVDDVHKDKRGYDLHARHRKTKRELHVEVKGTSGSTRQFLISRKEYGYMVEPQWRLAMVTNALGNPVVGILDEAEVRKIFDFESFTWQAREKA